MKRGTANPRENRKENISWKTVGKVSMVAVRMVHTCSFDRNGPHPLDGPILKYQIVLL